MTNRIGRGLNGTKKLLLASAGLAALAGPVVIGSAIGVSQTAAIHAQPAAAAPAIPPEAVPQQQPAREAPPAAPQDRRQIVMLFDLDSMTAAERTTAQQAAMRRLRSQIGPEEVVSVMRVTGGRVSIAQDFTGNPGSLESAIQGLPSQAGSGTRSASRRLAALQEAAAVLTPIPGKKMLMYFAGGNMQDGDPAQLKSAIEAAVHANVAIYAVDISNGVTEQPQVPPRGDDTPVAIEARAKAGSLPGTMARAFRTYGAPDRVEDRPDNTQVWHYNYLANFQDRAEFEFTQSGRGTMRVLWPPPLAVYEGTPGVEGSPDVIAGLPAHHAAMQTYPAGAGQILTVPLNSFSGRLDISCQISSKRGSTVNTAAGLRDGVNLSGDGPAASAGVYQASFVLAAGSYTAAVVVRDQTTGKRYGETIQFDVR